MHSSFLFVSAVDEIHKICSGEKLTRFTIKFARTDFVDKIHKPSTKETTKNFKKTEKRLDKTIILCYNIYNKEREVVHMIIFTEGFWGCFLSLIFLTTLIVFIADYFKK